MNPFDALLIVPILNVLIIFYKVFLFLRIPGALGLAIIFLTVLIRLILWPLTSAQLKSTQKMAALKPHLDRIKAEHGHDKVRHQEEVTKLYKEHGVNPLTGCLPLLVQIPVFIALYRVLLQIVDPTKTDFLAKINSKIYFPPMQLDKIPNTFFFGLRLEDKPSNWTQIGFFILIIPILTGLFQYIQSKMLMPSAQAPAVKPKKEKEKESMEDAMASMQSQMSFIMPATIAFFSYGFPVGLSLYWNTFTIIGIVQQYLISGAGSFNKYLPEKWRK